MSREWKLSIRKGEADVVHEKEVIGKVVHEGKEWVPYFQGEPILRHGVRISRATRSSAAREVWAAYQGFRSRGSRRTKGMDPALFVNHYLQDVCGQMNLGRLDPEKVLAALGPAVADLLDDAADALELEARNDPKWADLQDAPLRGASDRRELAARLRRAVTDGIESVS